MRNLADQKFGMLTVSEKSESVKGRRHWYCVCECGTTKLISANSLARGRSNSCGCQVAERAKERLTKHGMKECGEYSIWQCMLNRCRNPKVRGYDRYGGRGIEVDPRWNDFEEFYKDMGPRPTMEHSIDRIDNSGDYCKANCKWSTYFEQAQNRRRFSTNSSGKTGVSWSNREGQWRSYICCDGNKNIYLGIYGSFEEAVEARKAAELQCFGKYLDH